MGEGRLIDGKGRQRTFDLLGISRTGIMGVNLFCRRVLIQRDESMKEVFAGKVVIIATSIVWEVIAKRGKRKLLCEQVYLVQEQDLSVVKEHD